MVFDLSVLYYMDYLNEISHICIKAMVTAYDLLHAYSDLPVHELSALDRYEKWFLYKISK